MWLIVGLGNPGERYARTRHNIGFECLDTLAGRHGLEFRAKRANSLIAEGNIRGQRVALVKPQTYMNLSGAVLKPYMRRPFWAAATDLMVVVDEVALPIGRYRFRAEGSAGGHNGLKSVQSAVGNMQYSRLRIGIHPGNEREVGNLSDFVLNPFGKMETATVKELLPTLTNALELWLTDGITPVMNKYSGKDA